MAPIRAYSAKTIAWILVLAFGTAAGARAAGLPNALAHGIAFGGIGSAICCATMILQVRQFTRSPQKAIAVISTWSLVRYLVYGTALYKGHTLDGPKGLGMLGVVIGLFLLYVVVIAQAIRVSRKAAKSP